MSLEVDVRKLEVFNRISKEGSRRVADSKQLAQAMIPGERSGGSDSSGFSDMERSAIQEIGNIMTSGYIDGWANVLDTTIGMGTPTFTYGPTHRIIERMGGWPDESIVD